MSHIAIACVTKAVQSVLENTKIEAFASSQLTHLSQKFKKWSDFHETLRTLPKGRGKNMHEIFFVSSVVSEIWCMFIWTMPANKDTKLAKIRLKIIHILRKWLWSWSYLPMIILKWGTGRYLMNWIQVVSFKLKEIWQLFSIAKAKKLSSFFTSLLPKHESMKANLSQKAMKLGLNDNWGTGRYLLIEFKLFISNWKRFDLYFPLLKPKNRAHFLLPFRQSMKVWNQISVQRPWS